MGPEDSEVSLRYMLMNARRRSSGTFEIFSTKEKIDHLVASRNHWLEYQGQRVAQQYLCEGQEVLTDLVVSKKDMQRTAPEDCHRKNFEEQRAKEALVLVQKKHKLIKWEGERERARTMQRLEVTRTMSPWSGHARSSFGSCSSSLVPQH